MNGQVSAKVGKVLVISHDRFLSVLVSLVQSEQRSIKMFICVARPLSIKLHPHSFDKKHLLSFRDLNS